MKIHNKFKSNRAINFLLKHSEAVKICLATIVCLICIGIYKHNVKIKEAERLKEQAMEEHYEQIIREERKRRERRQDMLDSLKAARERPLRKTQDISQPKFLTNKIRQDVCDDEDEDYDDAIEDAIYDNIDDYLIERGLK